MTTTQTATPGVGRRARKRLDLLVLSEEVVEERFNKYNAYHADKHWAFLRRSGLTAEEIESAGRRHGLQEYLKTFIDPEGRELPTIHLPHRPALALCDLATVVRDQGYQVAVLDNVLRYDFRWRQLRDVCEQMRPRVIGLSTTFLVNPEVVEHVLERIREVSGDAIIVLGGPTVRKSSRLHELVDYVVFGSGEIPICGIMEVLDGRRSPDSVASIAYKDASGKVQYTQSTGNTLVKVGQAFRMRSDDQIPIPDWTLYSRSRQNVVSLEASRGCQYNCFYCSYDRGKITRSATSLQTELRRNADLGIVRYRFGDSNFTDGPPTSRRYAYDICKAIIECGLDLEWSCYARVDNMTPELADLMRKAGCRAVFFGVESGDDEVLKLMRKGHDVADAIEGVRVARAAGLFVHVNVIVGYPGDTHESYRRTVDFVKSVRPDTFTIAKFWLDDNAPVSGRQMRGHAITGWGNQWQHSTMDSETAEALIRAAQKELVDDGLNIGNEYDIAGLMSVGFNFDRCIEHFEAMRNLLSDAVDTETRARARDMVRHSFLEVVPHALSIDQKAMCQALDSVELPAAAAHA